MDIQIEKLTKTYPGGVTALDGIDLTIGKGLFGLLGPNGAGKTTLMRVLVTLIRPTSGAVVIDGQSLGHEKGRQFVRQRLGYLPQELGLYPDLSAEEFVDYVAILKGLNQPAQRKARVRELLELVNLTRDRQRKLKTFSGGMKRRVGIAQALVNDPRLLIVDEPTAGLDPEERIRFRNLLEKLGRERTVLLSTHIVEDIAQTCRYLAVQARGKIIFSGTTLELAQQAQGTVWLLEAEPGQVIPQELHLVGMNHSEQGVTYRVVGECNDPRLVRQLRPVAPTLEDGYIRLMQKYQASAMAGSVLI